MVKPSKNGTLRSQLEQIEKQTGIKPKLLTEAPEFPEIMSYVWSSFLKLNNARTFSDGCAHAISYTEMKAFMDITNTQLSSREVETVKSLDNIYLGIMNG